MRLIILGGPGSGRSTQAQRLAEQLAVTVVSTGEVLRDAIAAATEIGKTVSTYVEKGELVPDELMIEYIKMRLLRPDVANGWILEGYPRTAFQAEELDFLLDSLQQSLTFAISLEVAPDILLHRSLSRAREDDNHEAIERRIALHQEITMPMLDYYEWRSKLLRVDGHQAIETVTQAIVDQLPT
ncbi:adenylate kinase [Alkalinema pantanalense CENA528]|uniref:adenylate kinase n=1 Tax=Alkalinema pantanalense TaxID=1620705 RepID=UPI003D6DE2DC